MTCSIISLSISFYEIKLQNVSIQGFRVEYWHKFHLQMLFWYIVSSFFNICFFQFKWYAFGLTRGRSCIQALFFFNFADLEYKPILYINQNNARALIGQSAMGYCAGKAAEKSRVLNSRRIRKPLACGFFWCSTNIPPGLSAYNP